MLILACLAIALLCLAIWTVVPAPTMALLVLGVGVPELSPVLLCASLGVAAILALTATGSVRRVGCGAALLASVLLSRPLLQLPGTVRRFDAAMAAAGVIAPHVSPARGRPPFSWRDLLLGAEEGDVVVARDRLVATTDGEDLTIDVYRPAIGANRPVVVQIYGGAWQRGHPSDDAGFARRLASRGYVVCAIDYRHAPRWTWPAQDDDVAVALRWIRARVGEYGGDARRLVLVGRSAGAQLALMAAYRADTPVAGVVAFYAPVNLAEGWREPPVPDPLPVRPVLEAYLGGRPDQVPDRYRDASPVHYVSRTVPPTLLLYGARDHIVEARFGRELHERLRQAGATSIFLDLPWSEHAFDAAPRGLGLQVSWFYVERFIAWAVSAGRSPR